VPPNNRVEPLTAEAIPAFCLGTASMMASVAGAWVSPIPTPSSTICATMIFQPAGPGTWPGGEGTLPTR